jgi:hypothetical protein
MNVIKVKELLDKIENVPVRKIFANYVPSFCMETFLTSADRNNELLKILTNPNYKDDEVSYDLVKLEDWKTFFRQQIQHFMLDAPPFEQPGILDSDQMLHALVNNLETEVYSLNDCECFEVKSLHKRFYDIEWADILIITNIETYFFHFGISD